MSLPFRRRSVFWGAALDRLLLHDYLSKFLEERNRLIREVAESDNWLKFIPSDQQSACE